MITNAKDTPLTDINVALPNMAETLCGWFKRITFIRMDKTIVNFEVVEVETPIDFIGVVQNLNSKQLEMKPEGQRAWSWKCVHCLPGTILKPDDVIKYTNIKYRIMEQINWNEYGYLEYHMVKDYER